MKKGNYKLVQSYLLPYQKEEKKERIKKNGSTGFLKRQLQTRPPGV